MPLVSLYNDNLTRSFIDKHGTEYYNPCELVKNFVVKGDSCEYN